MSIVPPTDPRQIACLLKLGLEDPTETQVIPGVPAGWTSRGQMTLSEGASIGGYRLLEQIGEGGFGVVWRAEKEGPWRREVALKLIKPGMDSREIIARFESERRALSLMEHPNIAAVLDAGATESGQPYFVMELVKGQPITAYCDEKRLSIRERLELFLPVCQAVQHAHQKAVLHRDLKPSNILVVEVDGRPVPKIIDFGIAKALAPSPDEVLEASLTRTLEGMIVGTPQYMSPEQAGSVPDVDTRSDVYTLGVVLHDLLTGTPPLSRSAIRGAALDRVLATVRDLDVSAPSSRFAVPDEETTAVARARQGEVAELRRLLRGELDWVVLKAVEKDRERRYQTAADLATDLRRFLNHEPVTAGQPGRIYRLRRFVRRHRAAVSGGIAVLAALSAGVAMAGWRYLKERDALEQMVKAQERAVASEAATVAEALRSRRLSDFMLGTLMEMNPKIGRGRDVSVLRDVLLQIDERRRARFGDDPVINARLAYALAVGLRELNNPKEAFAAYARALDLLRKAGMGESIEAAGCLHGMALGAAKNPSLVGESVGGEIALAKAADLHRQSLEIHHKLSGVDPAGAVRVTLDFGEMLVRIGRAEEGMKWLDDGMAQAREKNDLGSLARAFERKATATQELGDLATAESLAREGIRLRQMVADNGTPNHAILAESWRRLFEICRAQKNATTAMEAAQRVFEHRRKELGYDASGPLMNLGSAFMMRGDLEQAKDLYRRALESSARFESHPYRATILERLIKVLLAGNDREGAEKVLREAITALRAAPDADPDDLKYATERLARLGVGAGVAP